VRVDRLSPNLAGNIPPGAERGCGKTPNLGRNMVKTYLGGFYETAVNVKVFVFVLAFVFSLVAFLFLYLLLSLVRVLKIHLGLLYALAGSRCGLGA
jgi:hypothetical protein